MAQPQPTSAEIAERAQELIRVLSASISGQTLHTSTQTHDRQRAAIRECPQSLEEPALVDNEQPSVMQSRRAVLPRPCHSLDDSGPGPSESEYL